MFIGDDKMKKIFFVFLVLLFVACLTSCTTGSGTVEVSVETPEPEWDIGVPAISEDEIIIIEEYSLKYKEE